MGDYRDDQALLDAAAGGDRRARGLVAERLGCVPPMVRLRRKHLGSALEGQQEDIVQDVVLAVWTRLDRFRQTSSFEAWVWGFVLRITYRRVERVQNRPTHREVSELASSLADSQDEDPVVAEERQRQVHLALADLDQVSREIVLARHFNGQEFDAIADKISMPVNTVKTRYYRGLKRLATKLGPGNLED